MYEQALRAAPQKTRSREEKEVSLRLIGINQSKSASISVFSKMSKSKIILFVILAAAVAAAVYWKWEGVGLPGFGGFRWIDYESPEALAKGGNFSFRYPSLFEIKSDEWRIDQYGERHAVIFALSPEPVEGDAAGAILEINVARGPDACGGYDACEIVQSVAIGIKGGGGNLHALLPEIAASFVVL
ncbi:MAG: hypothetical protein AAB897_04215 [Patescibacteria group bacterium]